ncbi:MAG TPA: PfkB family carbohydrate kinase [Anaerolineaceae bacterium]
MLNQRPIEPIDYLLIGHITQDLIPAGFRLGGTVSFSSLTALSLGLRVGIVTSCREDLAFPELDGITVVGAPSEYSTTFENIQTTSGRVQYLHHRAANLDLSLVPETWRNAPIVHLGPVDQEVDPNLVRAFPNAIVGLTPQGWLRSWDSKGRVHFSEWPEAPFVLSHASAAVLSIEDIHGDESYVEEFASSARILVVTEGPNGARLYWNGDVRRFRPPKMHEVDPTGAGDIFAAAFFSRLSMTRDPWEAARFATNLAAYSVTRTGLHGVPTRAEVESCYSEVVEK